MDLPDVFKCLVGLAHPEGRAEAARTLAHALGADDIVLLVADAEIGTLLPLPGVNQSTLPGGATWRLLLDR